MEEDEGHKKLVRDLETLLTLAVNYAFHDFKNDLYVTPKVELASQLSALRDKVISGEYDN